MKRHSDGRPRSGKKASAILDKVKRGRRVGIDRTRTPTAESTAVGVPGGWSLIAFDSRQFLAARALAGYSTDAEVAAAAGVTRSLVTMARGGLIPAPETQTKIAGALGVEASRIWRECVPVDEVRP